MQVGTCGTTVTVTMPQGRVLPLVTSSKTPATFPGRGHTHTRRCSNTSRRLSTAATTPTHIDFLRLRFRNQDRANTITNHNRGGITVPAPGGAVKVAAGVVAGAGAAADAVAVAVAGVGEVEVETGTAAVVLLADKATAWRGIRNSSRSFNKTSTNSTTEGATPRNTSSASRTNRISRFSFSRSPTTNPPSSRTCGRTTLTRPTTVALTRREPPPLTRAFRRVARSAQRRGREERASTTFCHKLYAPFHSVACNNDRPRCQKISNSKSQVESPSSRC